MHCWRAFRRPARKQCDAIRKAGRGCTWCSSASHAHGRHRCRSRWIRTRFQHRYTYSYTLARDARHNLRRRGRRSIVMDQHGLIAPILALVVWTLVIWIWMYATRIPAIQRANLDPQAAARTRTLNLPAEIMWVSDNYNHLMEQPTIFYATAIAAQIAGQADPINIGLAWAYVVLRVVHSMIQCTVNIVMLRFSIFTLSTIALAVMVLRTAAAVF